MRASAHAFSGQVLRHKTSLRVLLMDSEETRTIACSSGAQEGDPVGPAIFFPALRPGLKRFRQEFEREGVKSFAYLDDVSLGFTGITANTIRAFVFLRRELDDIGIVVNAA